VLDRTGGPEDAYVDQILTLAENGQITLLLPHSVKAEIEHPSTPDDVKQRAMSLIYTVPVQLTPEELRLHDRIRGILQGNAKPGKHDCDAFHIVESDKNGGGYFITNDKRIIKKGPEIAPLLQIAIMTPTEFVNVHERFEREGL
jgi:hypothetical protein